ncbi:MAG: hypothetical protein ACR5LD_01585 [Symbiopectobacterium sp.]
MIEALAAFIAFHARCTHCCNGARPMVIFYGLRNTAQARHLVLKNGACRLRIVI